ncbi:MAG: 6-phosphogluconolactonase [Acidobacteria bacterium]|nr:6-phosphogluconolactonase [Acidobacteriota bacterium]
MSQPAILVSPKPLDAARACGDAMLNIFREAIDARGSATVAVSGGTTPKLLFQHFAASGFDWSRVHLFWVDERAVPPGDPQSNYTLAHEYWLESVGFPAANLHRIEAELPVAEAASRYATTIRGHFGTDQPVFDVIQQGMGADAHTASLFPGEPLILDNAGIAAAVYVEKLSAARITLLPGVLKAARNTMMLVTGADKGDGLRRALHGPESLLETPIQLTRSHAGNVTWFLDEAAAIGAR